MTSLNINRKVTDCYYRYKMPKIVAKVEGRGNGIKTVVANLCEVSKALNRPPLYPLKYMGCELGAQTISDVKNDRYIINGAHDSDKLQNILDTFIERYVLCESCSNPETVLSVAQKKETISMKCIACGHTSRVSTTHRASTYILKNPPTKNAKNKPTNPKKSTKTAASINRNSSVSANVEKETSSAFAKNTTKAANDASNVITPQVGDDGDECHWNADVSEAAVKLRQQLLSSHLRALTINADTDRPIHEKLEILREFIQCRFCTDNNLENHFDDIVAEVKRLDIMDHKAVFSISSVIFDGGIVRQLSQHHNFLRRFCSDQPKVQKYLIASVERIVEQYIDQLIDRVPVIFKIMFEAEIIDEEVFLEWDSKKSSRFVSKETYDKIKAASFKFMDWLKNAEVESSSSDGEQEPRQPSNASFVGVGDRNGSCAVEEVVDTQTKPKSSEQLAGVTSEKLHSYSNGLLNHETSGATNNCNNEDDIEINIDDI